MLIFILLRTILLLVVLIAIYLLLLRYLRWDQRRWLEREYEQTHDPTVQSREEHVTRGMVRFEQSWQRKALYGVFIIPPVLVLILAQFAK